jgi:hypothetical protein
MKTILSLTALMLLGVTSVAHASTLAVNLGNTGTDLTYGVAGALNPNIDVAAAVGGGSLVLNNADAQVVSGSLANDYTAPTGSVFGGTYLAVLGDSSTTGLATYTLASGMHSLAFTWGTIDDYNTLVITDSRNVQYTITGTDILNHISGSSDHATQSDVNFIDTLGTIVSAEFMSTQNSFEAANFGQSNVPLPPALSLFCAGFVGLVLFATYRRRRAV